MVGGLAAPQTPLLPWGGAKAPPDPQVRTAREHEVIIVQNMMSNHADMQDKYCRHSNDIDPIQSQYKGNHHLRNHWP